jgi:hypothetical protein
MVQNLRLLLALRLNRVWPGRRLPIWLAWGWRAGNAKMRADRETYALLDAVAKLREP